MNFVLLRGTLDDDTGRITTTDQSRFRGQRLGCIDASEGKNSLAELRVLRTRCFLKLLNLNGNTTQFLGVEVEALQ